MKNTLQALCLSFLLTSTFWSGQAQAFDEAETKQIENIIRSYLLENPEILVEVSQALQAKQQAEEQETAANGLQENKELLLNSENAITLGDPDAPFTVVEFFDYNCPYCRRSLGLLQTTLEQHKDVKFVMREWPIFGEESLGAHRVSLALQKLRPDLYEQFHVGMMSANGRASEQSARELAVKLGVDEKALNEKLEDGSVEKALVENNSLAQAIGARGVPAFIIGDEFIPGAIAVEELQERFESLRKCGATDCS